VLIYNITYFYNILKTAKKKKKILSCVPKTHKEDVFNIFWVATLFLIEYGKMIFSSLFFNQTK